MVLWDDLGGVFGGFFTHSLEQTNDFFGNGQSFLYSTINDKDLKVYRSSSLN